MIRLKGYLSRVGATLDGVCVCEQGIETIEYFIPMPEMGQTAKTDATRNRDKDG